MKYACVFKIPLISLPDRIQDVSFHPSHMVFFGLQSSWGSKTPTRCCVRKAFRSQQAATSTRTLLSASAQPIFVSQNGGANMKLKWYQVLVPIPSHLMKTSHKWKAWHVDPKLCSLWFFWQKTPKKWCVPLIKCILCWPFQFFQSVGGHQGMAPELHLSDLQYSLKEMGVPFWKVSRHLGFLLELLFK